MASADLVDWLAAMSNEGRIWLVKRLAANDTLASEANQAGPYIPKEFLFAALPEIELSEASNPDARFTARIDSHADERAVRAVWYNSRLRGGTRNEARITNWGGAASPLLDPESTGAIAVFAFAVDRREPRLRVWVCRNLSEEHAVEDNFGPIDPGFHVTRTALPLRQAETRPCRIEPREVPHAWIERFPSGAELVRKAVELRPLRDRPPDDRLLGRRSCEYEIFLSVEEAIETPIIRAGFDSVDAFVSHAQSVLQRRKARSGRSLELQMLEILREANLVEGRDFDHQPESDPGKHPDFLFPSAAAYRDPAFDPTRLRMLAAKTTCRDRWRQILNEADRIQVKHLLTLQEGVSRRQFTEMLDSGVQLVVPAPLRLKYPEEIRPRLLTVSGFLSALADAGVVTSRGNPGGSFV